jgi:hypothetical protein
MYFKFIFTRESIVPYFLFQFYLFIFLNFTIILNSRSRVVNEPHQVLKVKDCSFNFISNMSRVELKLINKVDYIFKLDSYFC